MPRYSQGDTPHIVRGVQKDYKNIYFSRPEMALVVDIAIQAGYGLLEAGTVLAKNLSAAAARYGKYVPYTPTLFTGLEVDPGRAYLVTASGTTASVLYVTIEDSYKFAVGDDVIIDDNVTAAENLGAITAIDRTTYPHMAAITVTTATGGTSFTVARKAHIKVEAGDSSNNYSDAVAILAKSVDTGSGVNAQGAVSPIILSNAILYEGMLVNLDSAAKTDLGVTSFGQYAVLK
jgi:hypothetical protein